MSRLSARRASMRKESVVDENKLWINLNDDELQTLQALQSEMGLDNPEAVMRLLLQQAHSRAAISCPTCGHSAHRTEQDRAKCDSCMSVLQLSNDIWSLVSVRPV